LFQGFLVRGGLNLTTPAFKGGKNLLLSLPGVIITPWELIGGEPCLVLEWPMGTGFSGVLAFPLNGDTHLPCFLRGSVPFFEQAEKDGRNGDKATKDNNANHEKGGLLILM